MKRTLSLVLLVLIVSLVFVGIPAEKAKAFEWPQECRVPVWNAASQAGCAWAIMIEIYGSGGDWPD
jgi:hypothetical protein